jgi:hypothetical protein
VGIGAVARSGGLADKGRVSGASAGTHSPKTDLKRAKQTHRPPAFAAPPNLMANLNARSPLSKGPF